MKTIVFTGGGTAGHVTPNLALMDKLDKKEWNIHYIGTKEGIERQLIEPLPYVTYHAIAWGKLRRYFSWKNFTDPFRVLKGYCQAEGDPSRCAFQQGGLCERFRSGSGQRALPCAVS